MKIPFNRRIFLFVGLPLGATLALWHSRDYGELARTTIIVGTLGTLALVAVMNTWHKYVPRGQLGEVLAFPAVLATMTVFAMAAAMVLSRLPHGQWTRLPDAPAKVHAFTSTGCTELYSGKSRVHVLDTTLRTLMFDEVPNTWSVVPTRNAPDSAPCMGPRFGQKVLPRPPGKVIQRHRIDDVGADCGGARTYLLLVDGSLWRYEFGGCALGVAGGLIMSVVAVVFLAGVAWLVHRRMWRDDAPA